MLLDTKTAYHETRCRRYLLKCRVLHMHCRCALGASFFGMRHVAKKNRRWSFRFTVSVCLLLLQILVCALGYSNKCSASRLQWRIMHCAGIPVGRAPQAKGRHESLIPVRSIIWQAWLFRDSRWRSCRFRSIFEAIAPWKEYFAP